MSADTNAHVATFAFPFGTHAGPLLHLVRRLAAAAPLVRFSFFNTPESNRRLLIKANLEANLKVYDVDDGVPDGHVLSGNPMEAIELFIKATPENFGKALKETGGRITCLFTDAFLSFSADMAAELGIPWLALWTSGPTAMAIHMYTDEIHNKLGGNWSPDGTLDFFPGMSAVRVADFPQEILNLNSPFARLLHDMGRVLPRATAVVLNSFDGIEPAVEDDLKSKLQKYLTVGPSPIPPSPEDQFGCLTWLNDQPTASVVYISFGSMLTLPPPELVAIAAAIESKNLPYLWSFRDNSQRQLLENFFNRTQSAGKVVDWAPQPQVLAHPSVAVFVTHGGWNSVMESIMGGVPMICRPFLGDQRLNRRRVEETWRIGVDLELEGGCFSKEKMEKALDVVRTSGKGKEMRENVERLRKHAFKAIEEIGSSTINFKSLIHVVTTS